MSAPKLGRSARLYKDGVVIGYGKNISVKASAFSSLFDQIGLLVKTFV